MKTGSFDKLKQISIKETPKQKIVPIKERKRDNESSYTLWLNKELLKSLKLKAVEENDNVKNIVEKAIRNFLK
ncbi:hypothetical protein [Chryseobacterium potabilaquae]|jgi:hypothetical protein|uniref:CopG family transcriptional regulator n=1 Tax=Chryseobacterium potabilaquae TaxID=2675057 RepID=A0A6N4XDA5_9FLAO|nr:hypothetical protein [Chryseobacterium potabilaquae]CAA7197444.1 hypothetical protein CHRY9293_03503 [Chryseobacterium potabilaquae]